MRAPSLGWALCCCLALPACQVPPGQSSGSPVVLSAFACGAPKTAIAAIQDPHAPYHHLGTVVDVEGIVTVVLEKPKPAYFIETPDQARVPDAVGSEGLFVDAAPPPGARPGTWVRLRGSVVEMDPSLGTQTQRADPLTGVTRTALTALSEVAACGEQALPAPPVLAAEAHDWSRFESMRVRLPGPVTVIGNTQWPERGILRVSTAGRLFQSTELHPPGPEARRTADRQRNMQLLLDQRLLVAMPGADASAAIDAQRHWRAGGALLGVEGVLDRFGETRLLLTKWPEVRHAERPPLPVLPSAYQVAGFNLENWFNGDGQGGGFPTARGAADSMSAQRQRAKLVAALAAMQPDVAALIEIENDGGGPYGAITELVDALNAQLGASGDYAAVATDGPLGSDAITVGLIYRQTRVETVGGPAALTDGVFANARPPLAQAFRPRAGGTGWVVVANHWKSKGSCEDADARNRDQGDGQGCWNSQRVESARQLAEWLARDPTHTGIADALIIGDLNAYSQEDPLRALRQRGYMDLLTAAGTTGSYSYVFEGRSGCLDHALASPGLAKRVAGAAEWHINADELPVFGYAGDPQLYAPDPYRSSDHDPLIVAVREAP